LTAYTFIKVHHDGREDEVASRSRSRSASTACPWQSPCAVSLADDRGMTLCGFARRGSVNVYTHPQRVRDD
jgi:hypothetical protein